MGQNIKTIKTTRNSSISSSRDYVNYFGFIFRAINTYDTFITQIKISFKALWRAALFIFFAFFRLIKNVTVLALYPWSHGPPTPIMGFGFSEYTGGICEEF